MAPVAEFELEVYSISYWEIQGAEVSHVIIVAWMSSLLQASLITEKLSAGCNYHLPSHQELLCCHQHSVRHHINTFVKRDHPNSLCFLIRTCQEAAWKHDKDSVNLIWETRSAEISYAVFLMVYNALAELSEPTLGLNDVINPIRTALNMSVLIHCK